MQSARSLFRRASRRMRRSTTRSQRTDEKADQEEQVNAETTSSSESPSPTQSCPKEVVSPGPSLPAGEMAAAVAKLSDLDSLSSIEDVTAVAAVAAAAAAAAATTTAPVDCINQLLMKKRMELMFELRTIQNSHRPVSKGDQRRNIDRFLRHHLHGDVSSDTTSEGSNEGNSSPHRQRRNGVVLQELEGLSRQQSVTQRLQCESFRRDLENMVRGTVVRQEREVEAALRLRTAGLPGNRHHPLVASEAVAETGSHVSALSSLSSAHSIPPTGQHNGIPVAPPPPPPPPQGPVNWQATTSNHHPAPQHVPHPAPQHAPQPQQPRQQPSGNDRWPMPTAPWLVQNSVANNREAPSRGQIVQQAQREAVISDISELVHRQLVQETLESDFRGRLEFLMMNHLESTGTDGERVMNYVYSIPQSQHIRRNDFSHLGIPVSNSAQQATAAASNTPGGVVPLAFMQEMDSLRSRMSELHEMVRMSMEMQLDLQRAIRQEVSAALHQQNGTTPSTAAPVSEPASEGNCIICLDKEVDAVLYQCGHMCVCLTCALRLSTMGSHCPVCRAPIRDVIRAYRSQRN